MDELLAYAILLAEGYALESAYEQRLHALFLAEPDYPDYYALELLCSIQESVAYIRTHMNYRTFHRKVFGRTLMHLLKPVYQSMDIAEFGDRVFSIWQSDSTAGILAVLQGRGTKPDAKATRKMVLCKFPRRSNISSCPK